MYEVPEFFTCFSCSRKYKWRAQDAGRTFRCRCGIKLRCPDPNAESQTAKESLDDTVADVTLEEAFDDIETQSTEPSENSDNNIAIDYTEELVPRRVSGGVFGLGPAGETIFWGAIALVCLSSFILAAFVPKWAYIVAGALSLWGILKFVKSWRNWTRGRPWLECLDELFSAAEES